MNENKLVTVAEFAKKAGISKQRVYQLLNKSLKEFVQEVENRKMIDTQALKLFEFQGACSSDDSNLNGIEQDLETNKKDKKSDLIPLLQKTVEVLQEQLTEKDKQIFEKDKQISTLAEALREAQQISKQAQALHGGSLQTLLNDPSELHRTATEEREAQETQKNCFLARIFRKK